MRKYRLLVFTSHPIQYQAPLFRALAARPEVDLEVCFYSKWGIEKHFDPQFGVPVAWDIPLLDGYSHRFVKNIGTKGGPGGFFSLINPGVVSRCLAGGFDAIWIQGWALASNWLVWLAATVRGTPLLVRGESNGLQERTGWKGVVKRLLIKTFFSNVRAFLSIGQLNREFYLSHGIAEDKIFQTPYSVDNAFFVRQAQQFDGKKASLRAEYGLDPDAPVALFTGKLIAKKRPADLIEAFSAVREKMRCSLALVGDGALRLSLEKYVKDKNISDVHFLGFRNQSEIGKLYALADVFVLPSDSEPWGLSVNEAMCFGLPLILSDRIGSGFDLLNESNGFRYPCGNIDRLSLHLEQMLQSEERRTQMGRRSREIVGKWDIEAAVEGIVQAVESTVSAERRLPRTELA